MEKVRKKRIELLKLKMGIKIASLTSKTCYNDFVHSYNVHSWHAANTH